MTDHIPEAIATQKRRFSVVWLIPLLALGLGGWLTFNYLHELGTVIQIEFSSANGMEAGKTKIKHKDVTIGMVEDIEFTSDLQRVIVTATIDKGMSTHLTEGTRFWVVRARITAGEVTGLGTLLSGAYIGMDPGTGGKARERFQGMDTPPILFTEDHGSQYLLHSSELHSLNPGAPLYYRRLKVGEVISYELNEEGSEFQIKVFVHEPYNRFVNENTLFWNASGVDVKIGADGFEMQTESMISLLLGGIAFDNLNDEKGEVAAPDSAFILYKSRELAASSEYERVEDQFRLYFDSSARGLKTGAPVTLRGITVGHIVDVRLQYDVQEKDFKIPVTIEFEQGRFTITGETPEESEPMSVEGLIRRGLRAQLRSGNILTGQMLIDLDIYHDAEAVEPRYEDGQLILPTIPTTIDSLMASVSGFLERVSQMPLDEISNNLNSVLKNLDNTIVGIDTLVQSEDVSGTLENIQLATAQLAATLEEIEGVATGFSQDSDAYSALLRTMHELSGASRSLRQMAEYLERHPEALLKGKPR